MQNENGIDLWDVVFDADKLVELIDTRKCDFYHDGKDKNGVTLDMVLDCLIEAKTSDTSFIKSSPMLLRIKFKELFEEKPSNWPF
jgi:hypothetical protein